VIASIMAEQIFVSTAYLPSVEYVSRLYRAEEVFIEKCENYLKQTYRNRCNILSAHGPQILSVPVYAGSLHKTLITDIRIDYSKRWQQVHLRALSAAYRSSPFFEYYFENIEKAIAKNHNFLIDLNMELISSVLDILRINRKISYTSGFNPAGSIENYFRYRISPKIKSDFKYKEYRQVFSWEEGFVPNLSIIDLLFNMGTDAGKYL
jgi:hypothetical protein